MTIVAFDVDGVLADFDSSVSKRLGIDLREKRTDFDTTVDYGEEVHRAIGRLLGDPSFWVSLKPMLGARQQIKRLRDADFKLRFYSSLPYHFEALRRWWLWNNLKAASGVDKVYLRAVRHAIKGEFIVEDRPGGVGVDYYIDDRADTVLTVAAGGIMGYVHPAPWNKTWVAYNGQEYTTYANGNFLQVATVEQFVDRILEDLSV